ncbi:MAG: helix-turn-helix transcriptional regulator [Eubacterium sp.]|nr:helix-turn-helix transcriptional regulator [Eubacterium sp.]
MADVDPKLGELIKKTRLERQLTQEQVAEMIGCHSQYYKNLENGKEMPSVPMFCKIMRALHISSDEYVWSNQNRDILLIIYTIRFFVTVCIFRRCL